MSFPRLAQSLQLQHLRRWRLNLGFKVLVQISPGTRISSECKPNAQRNIALNTYMICCLLILLYDPLIIQESLHFSNDLDFHMSSDRYKGNGHRHALDLLVM